MTEDVAIYCTFVREEVTDYRLAGPAGPARINNEPLNKGKAAGGMGQLDRVEPMHMFRNAPVYYARSFVGGNQGETLDLLSRPRQIGEYNLMLDENSDWNTYTSHSRDIVIYNMTADKYERIDLRTALRNCGRFDPEGKLIGPKTNPGGDTDANARDLDLDFLTFRNKAAPGTAVVRENVQFIGDISYEFLKDDFLRNAGRTLEKALGLKDVKIRNAADDADIEVIKTITSIMEAAKTQALAGGVIDVSAETAVGKLVFAELAKRFQNVVGSDNLFLNAGRFPDVIALGDTPANRLWTVLVTRGMVPVIRNVAPLEALPVLRSKIGARAVDTTRVDNAFLSSLRAPIPKTHVHHIQSIIDGPGSVQERGNLIRDAVFEMVDAKVPDLKWLNRAAANVWFEKRVALYDDKIGSMVDEEEEQEQAPIGGQVPSAGKPQYGYALPGQQLPAGWQYVHSASANRRAPQSNADIPHCAEAISFIAESMDAAASRRSAAGATRQGGYRNADDAGMGIFSRVGMLADRDGPFNLPRADQGAENAWGQDDIRYQNLGSLLGRISRMGMSTFTQVCAMLYLGCAVNRDSMLNLIEHNVVIPFNFALFRPHCQVLTRIAIKVQDGGGAGNMFVGHTDLQIQGAANTKYSHAHYTMYMGAVVHTPKNVYVQPDIMVHDYQGGLACEFWTAEEYSSMTWITQHIPKDIICVALPYVETSFPNPLDISGRFYTEFKSGLLSRDKFQPLHYSTAHFYNQVYGFHGGNARRMGNDQPILDGGRAHLNRICWQGNQFGFNPQRGDFSRVRPNSGHWGPTYQGVAAIRTGCKNEQMKDPDYSGYSVV